MLSICHTVLAINPNPTSENLVLVDHLRTSLSNALMTTYTYKPLVGMLKMTDPCGLTTTYEYDRLNRLKLIKGTDGQILQQYDYHYPQ